MDKKLKKRVAIGIPTNRKFKAKNLLSLMNLVSNSEHDLEFIISTKGYTTAENRNYICAQAVQKQCDYILFTDDDMIFEPDVLDRLLAHDKDIVGGYYNVRFLDVEGDRKVIEYLDGEEARKDRIFKCKALGGGMLLVKTEILHKLPKPLFWYEIHKEVGMITMSNDWWFCRQARMAGYDVWCDPTLKLGHEGNYVY